MKKQKISLTWAGTFVELCMGNVTRFQKKEIENLLSGSQKGLHSLWYEDTELFQSLFHVDNWWSVDDVDHAMGFVFDDRQTLDHNLKTISYKIDGKLSTIDPDALSLSFYAPEDTDALTEKGQTICHGTLRKAKLHLCAEFAPPFDPSLITLSFVQYPDFGFILIDLAIDGHDDMEFTWEAPTTYLQPGFL